MHLMNKLDFKVILDDKKRKKAGVQSLYALSKFVRRFPLNPQMRRTYSNTSGTCDVFRRIGAQIRRPESSRHIATPWCHKNGFASPYEWCSRRCYCASGLFSKYVFPPFLTTTQNVMERTVLHDVSYGALTQLYAGTSVEGAELNGKVLCSSVAAGTCAHTNLVLDSLGADWKTPC